MVTDLFAARIPFLEDFTEYDLDKDLYGEINLYIDGNTNNLTFKKIVDSSQASYKTQPFTLSGKLFSGTTVFSSENVYVGKIYDQEFNDPTTVDVKIENGEIVIKNESDADFHYPMLSDKQYLEIEDILPKAEEGETTIDHILGFEKKYDECTALLGIDADPSKEMKFDYPESGGEYYSTQDALEITPGNDHVVTIKNTFDSPVPPTALNVFKHPELWTFLLVALALIAVVVPIQIIHKNRLRKALAISHSLNLHTHTFTVE